VLASSVTNKGPCTAASHVSPGRRSFSILEVLRTPELSPRHNIAQTQPVDADATPDYNPRWILRQSSLKVQRVLSWN
jgi:hypothetical protein